MCIFRGAVVALIMREVLPNHHMSEASKDVNGTVICAMTENFERADLHRTSSSPNGILPRSLKMTC